MFKQVKVGQHIEYMVQKLSKNIVIVKFHPDMKSFQILFSFFLSQGEISKTGMIHSGMKTRVDTLSIVNVRHSFT